MIRSLRFLGVRTDTFAATVALDRDGFGLQPVVERPCEFIGPDRSGA